MSLLKAETSGQWSSILLSAGGHVVETTNAGIFGKLESRDSKNYNQLYSFSIEKALVATN